ncbi:MAG: dockerin type I domain-containing protein, partial [Phycisphaerae bacterium]
GIGYLTGADFAALNPGSATGINPTDVVLKYTYLGDINLDGMVTADDFAQLDANYLKHLSNATWLMGDFNYDGVIDYRDFALANAGLTAYLGANSALAQAQMMQYAAFFGQPDRNALMTTVPEPASAGLILLGVLHLRSRRNRRHG